MDFTHEQNLLNQGFQYICGIDEVGRGPLAGPIVATAVIIDPTKYRDLEFLKESKSLTERKREEYFEIIKSQCLDWSVAMLSHDVIDHLGLSLANALVMQQAATGLELSPDYILADKMSGLRFKVPFENIIKGDQNILSIAASSVLAKVTRDRIMKDFAKQYPGYGFELHKGYGTKMHLECLEQLGPCPIHRRSFSLFKPRLF